jgi:hypothetical protein
MILVATFVPFQFAFLVVFCIHSGSVMTAGQDVVSVRLARHSCRKHHAERHV